MTALSYVIVYASLSSCIGCLYALFAFMDCRAHEVGKGVVCVYAELLSVGLFPTNSSRIWFFNAGFLFFPGGFEADPPKS